MRHDLEIPARHGLRQPVGDTRRAGRDRPGPAQHPGHGGHRPDRSSGTPPTRLLVNVSNPLTALCRAVTRETTVTRRSGCATSSSASSSGSAWSSTSTCVEVDPTVAGVNHLPLVTSLRIGDDDGFAAPPRRARPPRTARGPADLDGPPGAVPLAQARPGAGLDQGRRAGQQPAQARDLRRASGCCPGSADTHVAEFFPWFVHRAHRTTGRDWGVHHYGLAGHRPGQGRRRRLGGRARGRRRGSPWSSGELVAPLIDGRRHRNGPGRSRSTSRTRVRSPTSRRRGGRVHGGPSTPSGVRPRDVACAGGGGRASPAGGGVPGAHRRGRPDR